MTFNRAALLLAAPAILFAGCSESAPAQKQAAAPPKAASAPAPAPYTPPPASASPMGQTIDQAVWTPALPAPQPGQGAPVHDALIRAQVLLARAHFSPGVIDGQDGGNMKNAVAAFEAARGLPEDGVMDDKVWAELAKDSGPVTQDYVITAEDAAGPFTPEIPKDYGEMAKLERLGYSGPLEALAEKFHMDEALLARLNPGADFSKAGTRILVVATGPRDLAGEVARIEVDKAKKQVRAYGQDGKLMSAYPATVGSSDMPTPAGTWAVRTVATAPTWTYDPSRLNFGDKSVGKQTIAAGPNNPVGAVWIDLTKETYGIHGAPDPRLVGKTASHGCVRLTNWDAKQLSEAVSKGTEVKFLG